MGITVEYKTGKVPLKKENLLVQDISDMEVIEFWEDRLTRMKQDFAVTFREVKGAILYSIYTNLKRKGSPFRVKE